MANILRTIIENDKGELRRLEKMAKKVMAYEDEMAALSDEALKAKTDEFKQRYQNGESLDDLLYEAFAVVREGAKRVLGLFPYPVQIMGGIVLHHGDVPEMRTGEGKTLTATMPVYLNACLLYTSDAADDLLCVDLGGRRIIKKKTLIHIR